MKHREKLHRFGRHYSATLRKYLAREREAVLEEAYELGRAAIGDGLGILDMARVHLEAREKLLQADIGEKNRERISRLAGTFYLQSLSPFEATHRGFRETNAQLLKRNGELAAEIAERQHAEQALRESEERYSRLIETAHDVIFSLTPDGRFAALNRAFEKITGWSRPAWLGRSFAALIHPEEVELAVERFYAVLRGIRPEVWQYRVRKADGQYVVGEFTLARELKGGQPVGVFGIGRDITERKQIEEALKNLSRKILQAQEWERRRISRELHDEVGQSLTAISVTLAALRNHGGSKSDNFSRMVAGTQRLLEGTMETVHRFARELRPAMLDELGLLPALRSHVKTFSERTGLRAQLHTDPAAENLNGEQKIAIFRITQESLTNVAKHARASRVTVSLQRAGDGICLEIADNGKSFRANPDTAAKQKQRLGLLGMQERVRLINGQFSIRPEPGRGTTVRVTIPFQSVKADMINGQGKGVIYG
ncbi:MAG TPA: PAS domain S-box protein [Verrucomicrobiae bacterium]|nr:PAS domain S-box protein [Verrucomicrobiae bacterium]